MGFFEAHIQLPNEVMNAKMAYPYSMQQLRKGGSECDGVREAKSRVGYGGMPQNLHVIQYVVQFER